MGSRTNRLIAAATFGVPLLLAGMIAIEVVVAMRGPRLPETAPYNLDEDRDGTQERILWLGDSTAAGVGATSEDKALPRLVSSELYGSPQLRVLAVSGATVEDVVTKQLPRAADEDPTRLFISIGANDTTHLTSQRAFGERYRQMLDGLPGNAKVTLLGVPDMGAPRVFAQPLRAIAGARGEQLDAIVKQEAERTGAVYVDIRGYTSRQFRSQPRKYFAMDNFHPNDAGYQLWADGIIASELLAGK